MIKIDSAIFQKQIVSTIMFENVLQYDHPTYKARRLINSHVKNALPAVRFMKTINPSYIV